MSEDYREEEFERILKKAVRTRGINPEETRTLCEGLNITETNLNNLLDKYL